MSNHPELTFFVNDEVIVVHTQSLTVREILDDAGLSAGDHILVKNEGEHAIEYTELDQNVPLHPGLRLRARHRVTHYHIIVNGRERDVDTHIVTYEQIVLLAPNLPPPGDGVEYNVTFSDAVKPRDGDLIAGETVRIKNGTQFVVSPSNRS